MISKRPTVVRIIDLAKSEAITLLLNAINKYTMSLHLNNM